jgi:hypothetical protein
MQRNRTAHSALSSAITLAERGMHVFPVSNTGRPLVPWSARASADPSQVEAMWRELHDADRWHRDPTSVGVACGPSGIFVLDNDRDDGGDNWFGPAMMEHGDEWVRTPTVRTPSGGDHLYFDARGLRLKTTVGKRGGIAPGIDTRAHGGMVIAPDSATKRGTYSWEPGAVLGETPLQPVPEFIAKYVVLPPIPERRAVDHERGGSQRNSISLTTSPILSDVTAAVLADLDKEDAYVGIQAHFLGIPAVPLGTGFLCVVHGDVHPSAALWRLPSGHVRYHDFHAGGTSEEWLTFAEVYHAEMSGEVRKLSGPSHAVWQLRLLYECDLIAPVEIALPPLPDHALDSVWKAYEGFRLLLGLRWAAYPEREPVAYARNFVAAWCGLSTETAKQAVKALFAMDIIEIDGSCPSGYGKATPLFRPATRSSVGMPTLEHKALKPLPRQIAHAEIHALKKRLDEEKAERPLR